jgi:hypothetical protein
LRDIQHKIELVRSTRPHPHYSLGFRFPTARWDDCKELLAKSGGLYGIVESAYVAAHKVNECLAMRQTRTGNPSQILGVTDQDGIDAAYEAAGVALATLAPLTATRD